MSEVIKINKVNGVRPEFDVYIGRASRVGFKASKWQNRFTLKEYTLEQSLKAYEFNIRACILRDPDYYNLEELRGKRLGCWCITTTEIEPLVCHGQVLMKLVREML